MNSLELFIKNKTNNGSVHLEIKSSGDELGMLYLSEEQFNTLVNILRTGCFNKEVDFTVNDPYNREEDEGERPFDFFSID